MTKNSVQSLITSQVLIISMKKRFEMVLTAEQDKILEAKARSAGFFHKSEFVRFTLFMEMSLADKINAIYKKIIGEKK